MTDMEALRSTILAQAQNYGSKQRFGLFSQPITNAVGDDGQYKTKLHARGQNGKPITQLRNVYTNPTKLTQIDYFEPLKSLATSDKKDVFIEQAKRLLKQQNEAFNTNRKQATFVPASGYKSITNSTYKFIEQKNPELDPKRNRQQDGRVKSLPRNPVTNPMSKVVRQFFKQPAYISDPYDRAHNHELELMKKSKALDHELAYRPNSFVPKVINSDKKIFGLDVEINKKPEKQVKFNIYNHETSFRRSSPMKSGHQGFIEPFPKYMQNPPKELKRIDHKTNERGEFKRMSTSLTKPSPSITAMSARRSFNSFHR